MFLYPSIKFYWKYISSTHVKLSYNFKRRHATCFYIHPLNSIQNIYSKHISSTHVKLSYKFQKLFRTWHHLDTCQIETRTTNFKICLIIFNQSQNKLIMNEKIKKKSNWTKNFRNEKKLKYTIELITMHHHYMSHNKAPYLNSN